MALAAQRDAEAVLAGFEDWLRSQHGPGSVQVVGHERPSVGFSSETFLVDVARGDGDDSRRERLVLKLPPPGPGAFPDYDFALQARVQEAAAAAGVPAPVPVQVEGDTHWVGAPFLVMPAVAGHIVSEIPVRDHWLTKATPERATLVHGRYIDIVADINRIDWRASGLAEIVPLRDNVAEIAAWRQYLDWYADGKVIAPVLVDALDWCETHRPITEPEPSLRWGDVRLGNVIFDDERAPVAVLDWEMASIGAAEHDLAWDLTLQATQDQLFGRTVPGFLARDAVVARYESRLGRPVRDLEWYETLAMVRSTAIMTRIAFLHELVGQPGPFPIADNPILAILQRRIADA